jgi:outer membrane protein
MLPGLRLCWALNQNKQSTGCDQTVHLIGIFDLTLNNTIMKKILLFACLFIVTASVAVAQKYAIIDTRFILDKLPDYKKAQGQLDVVAADWQKDIDAKQGALDKMYKDYEAEQVMLSDDLKKKREQQLFEKEKELRDLQRQRFGFEGDLFKKRQELIKPIQDKVYNAVQKISSQRGYDFVLDKSEGITIIFADPKLDKSEDVLKELGVRN